MYVFFCLFILKKKKTQNPTQFIKRLTNNESEESIYKIMFECFKELQKMFKLNLENTELLCHIILCRFNDEFLLKYKKGTPKNEAPIETRNNIEKLFQKAIDLAIRNLNNDVWFLVFLFLLCVLTLCVHTHSHTHLHTHTKKKINRIYDETSKSDDMYVEQKNKNEISRIVYTPYIYELCQERLFAYIRGHIEWKEKYPIIWNLSMANNHIYCIQYLPYIAQFLNFIYQT